MRRSLAIVAILAGFTLAACFESEERSVTYENGTAVTLRVLVDEDELTTLQPGASEQFQRRRNLLPDHVQAFDAEGNLRYDKIVTWEELKANGWRLFIK